MQELDKLGKAARNDDIPADRALNYKQRSVVGLQSTGKSTLINQFSGARLLAHVGRCTQGINLLFLKDRTSDSCDYMILMDSEGLSSGEKINERGIKGKDNIIPLVAWILSTGCVFLMRGENAMPTLNVLKAVIHIQTKSIVSLSEQDQARPTQLVITGQDIDLHKMDNAKEQWSREFNRTIQDL